MAEGVDIESGASYGNEGVVFAEEGLQQRQRLHLVLVHVVGIGDGTVGDEMMGGGGKLFGRGSRHADVQLLVELTAVAREYLGVQHLRYPDG